MEMQNLGYNYRLTDIQAALGVSQLKRAEEGIIKRRKIANLYEEAFKNKSYILGQSKYVEGHAYHLYVLEVKNRLGLYNYLKTKNIFLQIHYYPAHLMPYYQKLGSKLGDFPNAEKYYENCISIAVFPSLSAEDQAYVIKTISEFYNYN